MTDNKCNVCCRLKRPQHKLVCRRHMSESTAGETFGKTSTTETLETFLLLHSPLALMTRDDFDSSWPPFSDEPFQRWFHVVHLVHVVITPLNIALFQHTFQCTHKTTLKYRTDYTTATGKSKENMAFLTVWTKHAHIKQLMVKIMNVLLSMSMTDMTIIKNTYLLCAYDKSHIHYLAV